MCVRYGRATQIQCCAYDAKNPGTLSSGVPLTWCALFVRSVSGQGDDRAQTHRSV
jgi:hypothetical protein